MTVLRTTPPFLARSTAAPEADAGAKEPCARPVRDAAGIYREHGATVERWAARLGGPEADLKDLVQDTFELVKRYLPRFRDECDLTTWLYRLTQTAVSRYRRRERWTRLWNPPGEWNQLEAQASLAPGPEERLASKQAQRLVYQVLDGLSERDRNVLILFEIEGLPGEEIARLMGLETGSIWMTMHRARQRFLARLEKLERAAQRQAAKPPAGRTRP
jgi:RNA polymerase sigma-70 factor (ECF subfamily)